MLSCSTYNIPNCRFLDDSHSTVLHTVTLHLISLLVRTICRDYLKAIGLVPSQSILDFYCGRFVGGFFMLMSCRQRGM
ncbi:hypothetical protein GLYMA_01G109900v4 [Glycine max]|uniref:Uncharacterized protein n=1 Tax=Glycine max TaxID=3847 RepID=A0A0R0LEJ3_SOYBN|nr:hypothetical protein JHK87_001314 [Glycine soja]KAH1162586.1 hypothetical protein GYH30_001190 [Glycine max]KRH75794.1 hypothetical protein GLYMA_01G109900v4 [Glycine max]